VVGSIAAAGFRDRCGPLRGSSPLRLRPSWVGVGLDGTARLLPPRCSPFTTLAEAMNWPRPAFWSRRLGGVDPAGAGRDPPPKAPFAGRQSGAASLALVSASSVMPPPSGTVASCCS
jgi:hypothetical protein